VACVSFSNLSFRRVCTTSLFALFGGKFLLFSSLTLPAVHLNSLSWCRSIRNTLSVPQRCISEPVSLGVDWGSRTVRTVLWSSRWHVLCLCKALEFWVCRGVTFVSILLVLRDDDCQRQFRREGKTPVYIVVLRIPKCYDLRHLVV